MNRTLLARSAPALLLLGALPALARPVVFSDTFQSAAVRTQWSSNVTVNMANENVFSWYNGRYTGQTIHLNLAGAPAAPHGQYNLYSLKFDFLALDSWDGDDTQYGPDYFRIAANGNMVFSETFSNWGPNQSYPYPPTIGPSMMGADGRYADSIYRNITIPFTVGNGQAIDLSFWSTATQGMSDESWGIDNVSVSYTVVPAPAAFAVPGLAGLTGMLRLGRRRG